MYRTIESPNLFFKFNLFCNQKGRISDSLWNCIKTILLWVMSRHFCWTFSQLKFVAKRGEKVKSRWIIKSRFLSLLQFEQMWPLYMVWNRAVHYVKGPGRVKQNVRKANVFWLCRRRIRFDSIRRIFVYFRPPHACRQSWHESRPNHARSAPIGRFGGKDQLDRR